VERELACSPTSLSELVGMEGSGAGRGWMGEWGAEKYEGDLNDDIIMKEIIGGDKLWFCWFFEL
jgi:hypothetical protein